jgi:plastocyanin
MSWSIRGLFLLVVGVGLLLAACDEEDDTTYRLPPDDNIIELGDQIFADHGTVDARGQAELAMETDAFYFEPTFIRGTAGQTLTLVIENNDQQNRHNFTMREISRDIPPGGAERIEVTFPESGVQLFFCRYHIDLGMRGELLVGDATPQPTP